MIFAVYCGDCVGLQGLCGVSSSIFMMLWPMLHCSGGMKDNQTNQGASKCYQEYQSDSIHFQNPLIPAMYPSSSSPDLLKCVKKYAQLLTTLEAAPFWPARNLPIIDRYPKMQKHLQNYVLKASRDPKMSETWDWSPTDGVSYQTPLVYTNHVHCSSSTSSTSCLRRLKTCWACCTGFAKASFKVSVGAETPLQYLRQSQKVESWFGSQLSQCDMLLPVCWSQIVTNLRMYLQHPTQPKETIFAFLPALLRNVYLLKKVD